MTVRLPTPRARARPVRPARDPSGDASPIRGPARGIAAIVVLAAGYAALAELTFHLAETGTPAFFPAAGLTLAAMLLSDRRWWPAVALTIVAVELSLDLAHGIPLASAAVMGVANAVEPLAAAALLCRFAGAPFALRTPRDLRALLLAGGAGAVLGAVIGTFSVTVLTPWGGWWPTVVQWWSGDALGQLVVAPAILSFTSATLRVVPRRPVLEGVLGGAALLAASIGAYVLSESAVAYLVVAAMLWGAVRFGTRGAAATGLVSAGVAAAAAAGHISATLVPGESAADTLFLVDVFLGVALLSAHLLAAEIQGRRIAEQRLRDREAALRAVVDCSPLPISEIDPRTGTVLSWNRAAERLFGWSADEAVGTILPTVPVAERDDHARIRERTIAAPSGFEIEVERLRKDGTMIPVRSSAAPILDADGHVSRIVTIQQDMSARRDLELKLVHQAQHDALTGLANRVLIVDRLTHALRLQSRHGGALAVLFCDVDRFKVINDSLGHHVGDELLVEVGRRIAGAIRDTDTLARLGGDEFVVLAENVNGPRGAVEVARRIGDLLNEPYHLEGRELRASASIGIAVAENGGTTADALLRDADAAMYRAKERGRARYELFDEQMREWTEARLDTELALREAIRRDELEVHYQPCVSLRDGSVHSVEALLRWRREGQMVSPAVFVPLAEELGLIVGIGAWVMRQACLHLAEWRRTLGPAAPASVSVNVSPRQLVDPTLPSQVASLLDATGLEPSALVLEITESVMLEDPETTMRTLDSLRDLGVRLSIDDFGTGYSSLSYLRRLPVNTVKIDRSFLLQLGHDPHDATIVGAVVDLAHSLGLDVVAEGIETTEQLAELLRLGCDHVQGFLLARPAPGSELVPLLARGGLLAAHLPQRLAG